MTSRCLATFAYRCGLSQVAKQSGSVIFQRALATSSIKLCAMNEVNLKHRPGSMDKYILVNYHPSGKYLSKDSVPETIAVSEMQSARGRFTVRMMIYGMVLCTTTAGFLIFWGRNDKAEHDNMVARESKR